MSAGRIRIGFRCWRLQPALNRQKTASSLRLRISLSFKLLAAHLRNKAPRTLRHPAAVPKYQVCPDGVATMNPSVLLMTGSTSLPFGPAAIEGGDWKLTAVGVAGYEFARRNDI
jgi:hypothetical protein